MATQRNPFGWTEIYVDDIHRAQKFYETVLQMKMEAAEMPKGMEAEDGSDDYFEMVFFPNDMDGPGMGGAIVKSSMFKPGAGGTLNYFSCEDCAVEISRVAEAGGKVLSEKMAIGQYVGQGYKQLLARCR